MRAVFNKCNGTFGTSGSVEFMFERKCHFKIVDQDFDLEDLEFELIDFGAEEVFKDETNEENEKESVMIYGDFPNFGSIQKELETRGIEIVESGFERIPTNTKQLDDTKLEEVEKLLERMEEEDDVMNVYHNMA